MNKKIILFIMMVVLSSMLVLAWTPPSDADFRDYYNLYNVSSMTGENATFDNFFGDGSGLTNTGNSSFNKSLTDSLYIAQSDELNLNVNSSNSSVYWDSINSTSYINAGDIINDGTYISSLNESNLNVNNSNSSTYWDSISSVSDISGLIDSQIINISWNKTINYPAACPSNTYITQLNGSVTCQAISQIDNNLFIDGYLNVSKINIEDGNLITSLKSTVNNGYNYISLSSITPGDGREYWNIGANIGSFDNSFEFTNNAFSSVMMLKQDGNVGIGTVSPNQKLEVNGAINATFYHGDGSNLTGIASSGGFTTDQNNALNTTGNPIFSTVNITTGLYVDNVIYDLGNPTTKINFYSDGIDYEVLGSRLFYLYGGAAKSVQLNPASLDVDTFMKSDNGTVFYLNAGTNDITINHIGYNDFNFIVEGDNNPYLIYTDSANDRVGIGMSTPNQALDVNGSIEVSNYINQSVSGTTRYFSNGCTEVANTTGVYTIC